MCVKHCKFSSPFCSENPQGLKQKKQNNITGWNFEKLATAFSATHSCYLILSLINTLSAFSVAKLQYWANWGKFSIVSIITIFLKKKTILNTWSNKFRFSGLSCVRSMTEKREMFLSPNSRKKVPRKQQRSVC